MLSYNSAVHVARAAERYRAKQSDSDPLSFLDEAR